MFALRSLTPPWTLTVSPGQATLVKMSQSVSEKIAGFQQDWQKLKTELARSIVGQEELVENCVATLFAGGHALIEGVPGLGKTSLVRAMSSALDLNFRRIQFTPDLMPTDITGTQILTRDADGHMHFEFQEGPLFANVVLADEINRATPKTQSALLEVMQERSVTTAGKTRRVGDPFIVLATQNPLEMDGTYRLPEAQLDRFMVKLIASYPSQEELESIVKRSTAPAPELKAVLSHQRVLEMRELAKEVVVSEGATRDLSAAVRRSNSSEEDAGEMIKQYVRVGASPRAAIACQQLSKVFAISDGRAVVDKADIARALPLVLRHRFILNFDGVAENISVDKLVEGLI